LDCQFQTSADLVAELVTHDSGSLQAIILVKVWRVWWKRKHPDKAPDQKLDKTD